jgi:hypothetical protein
MFKAAWSYAIPIQQTFKVSISAVLCNQVDYGVAYLAELVA